jgi:hypothetical protein
VALEPTEFFGFDLFVDFSFGFGRGYFSPQMELLFALLQLEFFYLELM